MPKEPNGFLALVKINQNQLLSELVSKRLEGEKDQLRASEHN